ncbi:hypothetical protein CDIK_0533 [Cucumispora dikerogammari]|nr:hypothetical protein CDIK_0533 [Cucumispora dikerogammari]
MRASKTLQFQNVLFFIINLLPGYIACFLNYSENDGEFGLLSTEYDDVPSSNLTDVNANCRGLEITGEAELGITSRNIFSSYAQLGNSDVLNYLQSAKDVLSLHLQTGEQTLLFEFINASVVEYKEDSNITLMDDISEKFNETIKSWQEKFQKQFPNAHFHLFKKFLLETVSEFRKSQRIERRTKIPLDQCLEPSPLKMGKNTCYMVSALHLIKTNPPIFDCILNDGVSHEYKDVLLRVMLQAYGDISDEDFTGLTPFFGELDPTNPRFSRGVQGDPIELLGDILVEKCNLSKLQFFLFNDVSLTRNSFGGFEIVETKTQVPQFRSHFSKKSPPIIYLSMNHEDNKLPINIQSILYGTQYTHPDFIDKECYTVPMFLNAPLFLIINLEYNVQPAAPETFYGIEGFYEYKPHPPLIFQDNICVRSIEDGQSGYYLTGFIVNYSKYSNNTHYIPFYRYNGNWYSYNFEHKSGPHNFNFPLIMEFNDSYRVTALFYAKSPLV